MKFKDRCVRSLHVQITHAAFLSGSFKITRDDNATSYIHRGILFGMIVNDDAV